MKKKVLYVVLAMIFSVMCLGCGKDKAADQPVNDTEKVVEDTQQEEETEVASQSKVEDGEVVKSIMVLLQAEYEFERHMSSEWPVDDAKTYKEGNNVYYLITEEGATSWEFYEKQAREIYTKKYVEEEFIPRYRHLYKEKDGKLYRIAADGIVNPLVEDSIEVFESSEGRYYVCVFENGINGEYETSRIVEVAEGSKYGYLVADYIGYVK